MYYTNKKNIQNLVQKTSHSSKQYPQPPRPNSQSRHKGKAIYIVSFVSYLVGFMACSLYYSRAKIRIFYRERNPLTTFLHKDQWLSPFWKLRLSICTTHKAMMQRHSKRLARTSQTPCKNIVNSLQGVCHFLARTFTSSSKGITNLQARTSPHLQNHSQRTRTADRK